MKIRIFTLFLIAVLLFSLSGCALWALDEGLDAAEDMAENRLEAQQAGPVTSGADLTAAEAEKIALDHSGFAADQVTYLRSEYEIDDGVPHYDVQYRQDRWEYEYEIHAQTGAILSFEKDD